MTACWASRGSRSTNPRVTTTVASSIVSPAAPTFAARLSISSTRGGGTPAATATSCTRLASRCSARSPDRGGRAFIRRSTPPTPVRRNVRRTTAQSSTIATRPGTTNKADQPVPRHVHVRPPERRPHRGQQVEHAVEPAGDLRRDVEHEVGEVDGDGGGGHQQRRDEDGKGNAGDGEHHNDQGRRGGAGPAVAPLLLEEVDQPRSGHSAASYSTSTANSSCVRCLQSGSRARSWKGRPEERNAALGVLDRTPVRAILD